MCVNTSRVFTANIVLQALLDSQRRYCEVGYLGSNTALAVSFYTNAMGAQVLVLHHSISHRLHALYIEGTSVWLDPKPIGGVVTTRCLPDLKRDIAEYKGEGYITKTVLF